MTYRAEIDGLRAIAVISVMLYHAGFDILRGGFTGVDIFFVISGYLISANLTGSLENGTFSFTDFYYRRVKRILPASLLVAFVTLMAGSLLLAPHEWAALARSALASALFFSNVYFLQNTGYFDGPADEMPLLHTWSLGVEEQFYVVWPVILLIVHRIAGFRTAALVPIATLILGASFYASLQATAASPDRAFYLMPFRVWEFALGASVAWLTLNGMTPSRRAVSSTIMGAGLMLVTAGLFLVQPNADFPGWYALLPAVGAALMLWSSAQQLPATGRWLTARPLRWIGRLSYSLYLWHWPVLVYYRLYRGSTTLSVLESIALIAATLVLAQLSWWLVEEPARRRRWLPRNLFLYATLASALLIGLSDLIDRRNGFAPEDNAALAALADLDTMWAFPCKDQLAIGGSTEGCLVGAQWGSAQYRGLILGDSHAEHYAPILDLAARDMGLALVLLNTGPPFVSQRHVHVQHPSIPDYAEKSERRTRRALGWAAQQKLDVIIIGASWYGYSRDGYFSPGDGAATGASVTALYRQALQELFTLTGDSHVLFLGEAPRALKGTLACSQMAAGLSILRDCARHLPDQAAGPILALQAPTAQAVRSLAQERRNAGYLDTFSRLCGSGRCPVHVAGEPLYRDESHWRRNLPERVRQRLADILGLPAALCRALQHPPGRCQEQSP